MKVADVMTPDPLTVGPSDTIRQAEELMEEHKIRQLPVVEEAAVIGIVTDRDLRSFLSGRLFGSVEEREMALNAKIGSVMTRQPLSLAPDDDLDDAVELLIEEKVGGIPVVDGEERLVGIVTTVDVLRCFLDSLKRD